MDERDLVDAWLRYKLGMPNFYRLRAPRVQEFEYRGPQPGHPSNYARVRFECAPADALTFRSDAPWPRSLEANHCANLERAIGCAVFEVLLCRSFYSHRGCAVTLTDVGWDDLMSSEVAFYVASKRALDGLVQEGRWDLSRRPG